MGYEGGIHTPDTQRPLGVAFPGDNDEMWHEPGQPNWVGHLISKYAPPPRYDHDSESSKQTESWHSSPILVYDFAVGGENVYGVSRQCHDAFLPNRRQMNWTTDNALFGTPQLFKFLRSKMGLRSEK